MTAGRILPKPEVRFFFGLAIYLVGPCAFRASFGPGRFLFAAARMFFVFSPERMGPRRETISTFSHTGLYAQRSVRTPDSSGRAFGTAGGEEKHNT